MDRRPNGRELAQQIKCLPQDVIFRSMGQGGDVEAPYQPPQVQSRRSDTAELSEENPSRSRVSKRMVPPV